MNPFNVIFGKEPRNYISRDEEFNQIINSFNEPTTQSYLITGVRGTGKTVLLSQLSDYYDKLNEWIVININPEKNILDSLVAKVYSKAKVSHLFIKKSFTIGAHGISLSLQSGQPLVDSESILEIMLEEISKQNKKLLILIDEVTNSKDIRIFAHTFQSMVRENLPIYLLMTGLPENLSLLQNEKTLTFLYRAPKLYLNKLNETSIYINYLNVFGNTKLCQEMTNMVGGYAYAYQLLGMLVFDNNGVLNDSLIEKYDSLLANNSYSKIWSELNQVDKAIMRSIVKNDGVTYKIMDDLDMRKELYSVYRKRLIDKGYVDGTKYGILTINLPRFAQFIEKYDF